MSGWIEAACQPVICRPAHREELCRQALAQLPDQPADIWAAAAAGDAASVAVFLAADPGLALRPGGPFGWPPLLYACCSRLPPADGLRAVVRLLLDHGAALNGGGTKITPLYGAVAIADHPELVRLLLEAGADPDDGESLYHACGLPHTESLRLLLAHGATVAGTNALKHKLDFADPEGLRLLLAHGADPNEANPCSETALHHAILRGRDAETVSLLIQHGADVGACTAAGFSPYRLAARYGLSAVMMLLPAEPLAPGDQFLSACAQADRAEAAALAHLLPALPPGDLRLIAYLAALGRLEAVRLMLDLGFSIETPGDWGGPPLHQAAYFGHLPLVELLLERGADPEALNSFGGNALGAARAGAIHCLQPGGDHEGVIARLECP